MEEETKNKYLIGIVGALIGAFVGAIPWILLYIFANMMYSILAILIVLGGYYGYKITGAKIDKKLPVILSITSFISITVTMFLIIPICLMMQEEIPVTIESIQYIYGFEEFTRAIATDYVVSLLFCILVISGIIVNLNKQIREGINEKDIKLVAQDASTASVSTEDIEKVKTIFEREEALDKNGAIEKQTIMENLSKEFGEERAKKIFNYLKVQQIIKKKSGKYYFSERAQNSFWYRYGITSLKTFIIIVIVAVVLAVAIVLNEENNNEEDLNSTANFSSTENNTFDTEVDNIKIELPENMFFLSENQIAEIYGSEYASLYDATAISEDYEKMVLVFIDKKSNYNEVLPGDQFLKTSLGDENVEVTEKEVNGRTFYVVEQSYESEDGATTYISNACVYEGENEYLCMIIDSPEMEQLRLEDIIR